ncbi:MAG: TonB-dependent receptor plug domain-containing protein [bacterium]|nr:TonB-dependent receptor plug domain-containing protein [bacterium]
MLVTALSALLAFLLYPAGSSLAEESPQDEPIGTSRTSSPEAAGADATEIDVDAEADAPVGPPPGVEVMRIKGRAVSGIEADVPESVTQFDASAIAALGAGNIADLAKVTPNVEIRATDATSATFFIRGVGLSDFSANAAGAVAIFQDDVQLNAPAIQLGQLFDILTVDIKRGPQGHGLFRNASAGAIQIYANKPSGDYEAKIRSSTGSIWSDDAPSAFIRDTEGAVNLPLIEGALATRIAFRVRKTDPFFTNGCAGAPPFEDRKALGTGPGEGSRDEVVFCGEAVSTGWISQIPAGLPKRVGDRSDWAVRGALRFSPPESDSDWLLNVHGSRLAQDSTPGQVIGSRLFPRDPLGTGSWGRYGDATGSDYWEPDLEEEFLEYQFENAGVTNQADYDAIVDSDFKAKATADAYAKLARVVGKKRPLDRRPYRGDFNKAGQTSLETVGGYLRGDFSVGDEIDVTMTFGTERYERIRDADNDFSPNIVFETVTLDDAQQYSFDVLAGGELFEGAVRWDVGSSFLSEQLDATRYLGLGSTSLGAAVPRLRFAQQTSAYIATASFAWDFLEDFTLEIGARWNHETKDFRISDWTFRQFPEPKRRRQKTWEEPTGGIALTYFMTDTMSVYAKYTRGFKVGHFNSNDVEEVEDPGPASPEFIDSFEWGLQASWAEKRIQTRAALFFYRYQDYQVFIFRDNPNESPSLVIRNAAAVQQYGVEVDLTLRPLQDWAPEAVDGLEMVVRFGWLDSEFLEFTNTIFRTDTSSLLTYPVVIDYGGNRLINAPELKVSGTVEWPLDFGEWGVVTPRYDFEWSDDIFFDPTGGRGSVDELGNSIQPEYAIGQRAYWIHNVSLSYRTPIENVEVRGWVRNIMDQRYKTYAFDASFFAQQILNFVGDPRSAGADVTVTW